MYDFIVPQELNISDRIGPFTIGQWGFIAGGGLVVMLLLISENIPFSVSLIIGLPILLFCFYLALFKKHDMPIYEFLIIYIIYKVTPSKAIYSQVSEIDTRPFSELYDDEAEEIIEIEIF